MLLALTVLAVLIHYSLEAMEDVRKQAVEVGLHGIIGGMEEGSSRVARVGAVGGSVRNMIEHGGVGA